MYRRLGDHLPSNGVLVSASRGLFGSHCSGEGRKMAAGFWRKGRSNQD